MEKLPIETTPPNAEPGALVQQQTQMAQMFTLISGYIGHWTALPGCSCKKNCKIDVVTFSFVFAKHCPIMNYVDLKDSSRKLQTNCVTSYFFNLYLMLHAVPQDSM
jgi:hypothetical protein